MSLEATMLVLDNSSYSINGDYLPTRLQAQADAVHILFNAKLNANPENEVGLMVMAGKAQVIQPRHTYKGLTINRYCRPEVLVTPTQDEGKLISALHHVQSSSLASLSVALSVAQLALKHRQNKNQRQRIIVFVGSPLLASETKEALVKLGKKMKKNNVAIDIVAFGSPSDKLPPSLPGTSSSSAAPQEEATNEERLRALHEAVNASDNSNFLSVEPGPHLLSERISASPIMRRGGDDDGAGGGGGGGGNDEFGGIDPNMDPELAMALRMSLEEEQARQAALSAPAASTSEPLPSVPETAASSQPEIKSEAEPTETTSLLSSQEIEDVDVGMAGDADEDDDLARALALSRGDEGEDVDMAADEGEDDEDAEIARAIALSMKEQDEEESK